MRISVIVPARDEAETLPLLLADLRAMNGALHEIIVCDGGSRDATLQVARRGGARVLACNFGNRGTQMNAGARSATGDVFWFLHADARVSSRAAQALRKAFRENPVSAFVAGASGYADAGRKKFCVGAGRRAFAQQSRAASSLAGYSKARRIIGGNFVLRFDDRRAITRLFENIARWQRRRGVYYGDSGFFVTREAFEELGGFRAWPLFEDYDFARRLERLASTRGAKTACLRPPIRASARRFKQNPAKLLATWALFQTLFHCGVSPHTLAKIYHRRRN